MDDAGEAELLSRIEWALTTLAQGWTEEMAKEWWKGRASGGTTAWKKKKRERRTDERQEVQTAKHRGGRAQRGGGTGEGGAEGGSTGTTATAVGVPVAGLIRWNTGWPG